MKLQDLDACLVEKSKVIAEVCNARRPVLVRKSLVRLDLMMVPGTRDKRSAHTSQCERAGG